MPAGEHHTYGGTLAPLIVDDLVIAGVAGADEGIRGFVAAFKTDSGALAWRRWTVPRRGEPGIETWQGKEPITGGGSTWLTGSYDPSSGTLYWATGNPWPDSDDRDRPGDNLYTDSVLALNARTGELKWHYQFTPHDLKDRDATEPNILVDSDYKEEAIQTPASRRSQWLLLCSGPDRWQTASGQTLPAPRGLGEKHRTRWQAGGRRSARLPQRCGQLGFNRVLAVDTLVLFHGARGMCREADRLPRSDRPAVPARGQHRDGRDRMGGPTAWAGARQNLVGRPGDRRRPGLLWPAQWRVSRLAVDQRNGKTLWQFPTNVRMKGSPMIFTAGGRQYVAVAAGPNILCFGL